MAWPRITVVIACYNYAQFLPQCLDGYLGQTFPPCEIIVVDDCSTDNSREILARYAERHEQVRILLQEANSGLLAVSKRGAEAACGDYVYTAAVDDFPEPRLIENLSRLAADWPQVGVVTSNYRMEIYREDGTSFPYPSGVGLGSTPAHFTPEQLVRALRRCWVPTLGIAMFRRDLLLAGFRTDFGWWGDFLDILRLGLRHGLCYSPEPGLAMRVAPSTLGSVGRGDPEKNHRLLRYIVRTVFTSPDFRDVAERIERSQALSLIGLPIVRALCTREDWRLLRHVVRPKTFLVGALDAMKRTFRPLLPASLLDLRRRWRLSGR